jgi:hypothetical protein
MQPEPEWCSLGPARLFPILIVPARQPLSLLMIALTLLILDQALCAEQNPLRSPEKFQQSNLAI